MTYEERARLINALQLIATAASAASYWARALHEDDAVRMMDAELVTIGHRLVEAKLLTAHAMPTTEPITAPMRTRKR